MTARMIAWGVACAILLQLAACATRTPVAPVENGEIASLREAAENGDAAAQEKLGSRYANGEDVPKDAQMAAQWFRRAADHGFAPAQRKLGICYLQGEGVEKDERKAFEWLYKAAERGDIQGLSLLGSCYMNGTGVEKNEREGFQWIFSAANQGDVEAQNNLAMCYLTGRGVRFNEKDGVAWLRMSAEKGNANAQARLAVMYQNGWGIGQDDPQAVAWLQKAAGQDVAEAQGKLGACYLEGRGVPQDEPMAVNLLLKAAQKGDIDAQNQLVACYREGRGVAKNEQEADKWLAQVIAAVDGPVRYPPLGEVRSLHGKVDLLWHFPKPVTLSFPNLELWAKGDCTRIEMASTGTTATKSVALQIGPKLYTYVEGEPRGYVRQLTTGTLAAHGLCRQVEWVKKNCTQFSIVSLNGVPCNRYEFKEEPGRTLFSDFLENRDEFRELIGDTTAWLSRANSLPVSWYSKAGSGPQTRSKTAFYRELQANPEIPDSLFELPAGVTFADIPEEPAT